MVKSFLIGSKVYSKTGASYIVEEVSDNIIYCTSENGVEHDFSDNLLYTEEEWHSSKNPITDVLYANIKISNTYKVKNFKIPLGAAEKFLARCESFLPGLINFVSYHIAVSYISATNNNSQNIRLSRDKCRQVFDEHSSDAQSIALGTTLGINPMMIPNISELGEHALKAIIDKGIEKHRKEYEIFCSQNQKK
jgi:hypothetical protein